MNNSLQDVWEKNWGFIAGAVATGVLAGQHFLKSPGKGEVQSQRAPTVVRVIDQTAKTKRSIQQVVPSALEKK